MWKRFRSKRDAQSSAPDNNHTVSVETLVPPSTPSISESVPSDRRRSSATVELYKDSLAGFSTQRRPSERSDISNIHSQLFPASPEHQRRRSQDRRDDPLGLTVLHSPQTSPRSVDILFIHGLGGTSLRTWCKNRDLDFLWPKHWLPDEPDLSTARILTFGYHSHFSSRKQQATLTIGDFANDLLFRMKYGDEGGDRMGEVPIIVVAHSMGGLVFKKAYIQGHLNDEYRDITSSIKSVLFLATPHRGTDLAETLNRILSTSIFGHSPKDYVQELSRNSLTIDELNESFRHHADKLQIFSFYETLSTAMGPISAKILEKDSSVLGYHNETPQPLVADHHGVCKFTSTEDPNYKSVRGALRSITNQLRSDKSADDGAEADLERLRKWWATQGSPEDEYHVQRGLRKPGTCERILSRPEFSKWLQSERSCLMWANAPPGSGKSIHSAFLIDHLNGMGARCAYWFFRAGDSHKRSLANMLRSLAYQIAAEDASFRRALVERAKLGTQVAKADAAMVWREIFALQLAALDGDMYWVIDGLDESESSRSFVDLVSNIGGAASRIRLAVFSRPLPTIVQYMQRAKKKIEVVELALDDSLRDIRLAAIDEMEDFMSATEDFKHEIIDEITTRSQGNFLWASLVLKKVVRCHRQEDVRTVLRSTPDGMDKLYNRMADDVCKLDHIEDRALAKILLSWATHASRPVTIEELMEPYAAELGAVMDLKRTITLVCGQFVSINAHDQVILVHQTAREFLQTTKLLPFGLDAESVNEELLVQCLSALCDHSLRAKIRQGRTSRFLTYASGGWAYHLDRASAESDRVLEMLVRFFDDNFTLPWIQMLAISSQLSALVTISTSLTNFVRRRRKLDSIKPPPQHRLPELSLLETWALDLLRMTAKFGSRLAEDPEAIYKHIPPLSPTSSMLYQKFAKKNSATLSVAGLANTDWDDCLARVSNSSGQALHLAVSAQHLAVANDAPKGSIQLWDSIIFQESASLHPGEPICGITFSQSGALLACYGMNNTYVWRVSDGSVVAKVANPHRERAKALQFEPGEGFLIVATDVRRVYRLPLGTDKLAWVSYDASLLEETILPESAFINSPSSVAFNVDCTQLAVAYRGFPLAVWSLDPPEPIARCKRKQKQGQTTSNTWTGVNRVVWHPFDGQLYGIYRDGNIFKWGPDDDSHEEVKQELDATPSEIQCSRSGLVFATSDVRGAVRIYDCAHMVLIYKLTSDDIINAIAFSPDSRRFYDLRGSYCNVWEPNCLIRLVDLSIDASDDNESVTSSEWEKRWNRKGSIASYDDDRQSVAMSVSASEAHSESKTPITAIETCASNQQFFAYAKEDGTVAIYDIQNECSSVVAESAFGLSVSHLATSRRGDCVAYSTINGRITVRSVDWHARQPGVTTRVTFAEKMKSVSRGAIKQIILDHDSKWLFVCGANLLQVLDVTNGTVVAEREVGPEEQEAKWDNHPKDTAFLVAFTTQRVNAYSWIDLKLQYSLPLQVPQADSDPSSAAWSIETMLQSYHPQISVAVTSFEEGNAKFYSFLPLDLSPMWKRDAASGASGPAVTPMHIPESVADKIMQPVGVLADGNLVFFDEAMYVCTTQLRSSPTAVAGGSSIKRHFFVPRDWLASSGLMLCRVLANGKFLCPRKGDIAIITSDVGVEW